MAVRSNSDVTIILLPRLKVDAKSYSGEVDENGNTYLHLGALWGNLEVLRTFIDDINVDERNAQGDTALHMAIRSNQLEAINFLMGKNVSFGIPVSYTMAHLNAYHCAGNLRQSACAGNMNYKRRHKANTDATHVAIVNSILVCLYVFQGL